MSNTFKKLEATSKMGSSIDKTSSAIIDVENRSSDVADELVHVTRPLNYFWQDLNVFSSSTTSSSNYSSPASKKVKYQN